MRRATRKLDGAEGGAPRAGGGAAGSCPRGRRSSDPGCLRSGAECPVAADARIVDVDGEDREWLEQIRADLAEHWSVAPRIGKEEHSSSSSRSSILEVLVLHADGDELLADALELFQDVPAGKLAIADVGASTRDQVAEPERAGMDAVIVYAGNIADLVGSALPEV